MPHAMIKKKREDSCWSDVSVHQRHQARGRVWNVAHRGGINRHMVVIYSNGRKASCGRRYWRQGRCLVGLWTLFWLLQLCQWSRKQGHWLRVRTEEEAFWVEERGGGVQAPSHSTGEWRDSECTVWLRTFLTLVVTHLKWVWVFLWPYPVAQVWYRLGRELDLTQAVVLPNK